MDGKSATQTNVNVLLQEVVDELGRVGSDERLPISIDAEWKILNRSDNLDVIQMAYVIDNNERLFVFQVKSRTLPDNPKIVLNSPKVLWVGQYHQRDINRINLFFDGSVSMLVANTQSVNQLETVKSITIMGRQRLDKVCKETLGYLLPKHIRIEQDWSAPLPADAIEYAARDAWCCLLIFFKYAKNELTLTGHTQDTDDYEEEVYVNQVEQSIGQEARVHLDALHAMKRITGPIPKSHPVRTLFQRESRDTIFTLYENDVKLVKEKLKEADAPFTFDDKLTYDPEWVFKRVRRLIGPAEILKESLIELRDRFSKPEFTINGAPVLVPESLKALNEIIDKHCACLSDPTDTNLYYKNGKDSMGIPIYHCVRGTNSVESYHQWLERMFIPWCLGPELSDTIFTLLRHERNVKASEDHRPNFPKVGHSFHWILDQIQRVTKKIFGKPLYSWWRHSVDDKLVTDESFGFVSSRPDPNFKDEDLNGCKPASLVYICKKMKTKAPLLPMITREERRLFRDNVPKFFTGRGKTPFNFEEFAKEWNNGSLYFKGSNTRVVPGIINKVFVKSADLLEQYFKVYQKTINMVACQKALKKSVKEYRSTLDTIRSGEYNMDPSIAIPLDTDITLLDEIGDIIDSNTDIQEVNDLNEMAMDIDATLPATRTHSTGFLALNAAPYSDNHSSILSNGIPNMTVTPLGYFRAEAVMGAASQSRLSTFDYQHRADQQLQSRVPDRRKLTGLDRAGRRCSHCKQQGCPGNVY